MRPTLTPAYSLIKPATRSPVEALGRLTFSAVRGETCASSCFATEPLKLLAARPRGASAWVYASTFGGGLVAGDRIRLEVQAEPRTCCYVSTQSATKVFRSPDGDPCVQDMSAEIGDGAILTWLPDPVTCFADSRYHQTQRFRLNAGASLVMLDWLTSGRRARGERWAFSSYLSRTHIHMSDELVMADALCLEPEDGPLDSPFRFGRFNAMATLVVLGPRLSSLSRTILEEATGEPVGRKASLIASASPLKDGLVVRIIGQETEEVSDFLRRRLQGLAELLGEDPWSRKW
jgi:urease accessory protein